MILNNHTSVQGLYKYSEDCEFEKGDFIVYDDTLYICSANNPSNTENNSVCGAITGLTPDKDTDNYSVYPGDRVISKEEYYQFVKEYSVSKTSDVPDKFISAEALNEILSDSYFGIGTNGIVNDTIEYNDSSKIITYDIKGYHGQYDYIVNKEKILDTIIRDSKLNNGSFKVAANLPELRSIAPVISTASGELSISGIVKTDDGTPVEGCTIFEYVPTSSYPRKSTNTKSNGEYTITVQNEASRLVLRDVNNGLYHDSKYYHIVKDELEDGDIINFSVLRNEVRTVKGVVLDKDGNPIKGAKVTAVGNYLPYVYLTYNSEYGLTYNQENILIEYLLSTSTYSGMGYEYLRSLLYTDTRRRYGRIFFETLPEATSAASAIKSILPNDISNPVVRDSSPDVGSSNSSSSSANGTTDSSSPTYDDDGISDYEPSLPNYEEPEMPEDVDVPDGVTYFYNFNVWASNGAAAEGIFEFREDKDSNEIVYSDRITDGKIKFSSSEYEQLFLSIIPSSSDNSHEKNYKGYGTETPYRDIYLESVEGQSSSSGGYIYDIIVKDSSTRNTIDSVTVTVEGESKQTNTAGYIRFICGTPSVSASFECSGYTSLATTLEITPEGETQKQFEIELTAGETTEESKSSSSSSSSSNSSSNSSLSSSSVSSSPLRMRTLSSNLSAASVLNDEEETTLETSSKIKYTTTDGREISTRSGWTSTYTSGYGICMSDEETTSIPNNFTSSTTLLTVAFSGALSSIGNNSFKGCSQLKSLLSLSSSLEEYSFKYASVETIGSYAFADCNISDELVFPDNLKVIGSWSFSGNSNLTKVRFGKNIQTIGEHAFDGTNVSDIYFNSTTPPVLEGSEAASALRNRTWTGDFMTIHVPAGTKSAYESANNYPKECTYVEDDTLGTTSGTSGNNTTTPNIDESAADRNSIYKYTDKSGSFEINADDEILGLTVIVEGSNYFAQYVPVNGRSIIDVVLHEIEDVTTEIKVDVDNANINCSEFISEESDMLPLMYSVFDSIYKEVHSISTIKSLGYSVKPQYVNATGETLNITALKKADGFESIEESIVPLISKIKYVTRRDRSVTEDANIAFATLHLLRPVDDSNYHYEMFTQDRTIESSDNNKTEVVLIPETSTETSSITIKLEDETGARIQKSGNIYTPSITFIESLPNPIVSSRNSDTTISKSNVKTIGGTEYHRWVSKFDSIYVDVAGYIPTLVPINNFENKTITLYPELSSRRYTSTSAQRDIQSLILRQYTYLDSLSESNGYVRVQEIVDPQYGNIYYRYAISKNKKEIDFSSDSINVSSWKKVNPTVEDVKSQLYSIEEYYKTRLAELDNEKNRLTSRYCISRLGETSGVNSLASYRVEGAGDIKINCSELLSYETESDLKDKSLIMTAVVKVWLGNNLYRTASITFDALDSTREDESGTCNYLISSSNDYISVNYKSGVLTISVTGAYEIIDISYKNNYK